MHAGLEGTGRLRRTSLAVALLALVGAALGVARVVRPEPTAPPGELPGPPHLAVLPFENVSADPADAFYADALHNEVIAKLERIDGLVVRPRSSVLRYRESELPLARVAHELAVSNVLEADVQVSGGRLRATLRLTGVQPETPVWTGSFEAQVSSTEQLFSFQDSIASAVAEALRLEVDTASGDRPTTNEVAYALFLRSFGTPAGVRGNLEAATLLRQAIAFDPEFAEAHGQIAFRLAARVQVMGEDPAWADSAELHATRAVQLDPGYAYGWLALAQARYNQGRLGDAMDAYARALAVSPTWANPIDERAWLLFMTGRLDEAADEYVSALWLEPNARVTLTSIGSVLLTIGEFERADRWLRAAEAVIPDLPATRATRMVWFARQGRWDEARHAGEAWIRKAPANQFAYAVSARVAFASGDFTAAAALAEQAHRLSPGARSAPGLTAETILGASLIRIGRVDEGTDILKSAIEEGRMILENGEQRPGPRIEIAAAHAELGEVESALEWLEAAFDAGWRHSGWAPSGVSQFSTIADDPRFAAWLERERAEVERLGALIRSEHATTLDTFLKRWYELNPLVRSDRGGP